MEFKEECGVRWDESTTCVEERNGKGDYWLGKETQCHGGYYGGVVGWKTPQSYCSILGVRNWTCSRGDGGTRRSGLGFPFMSSPLTTSSIYEHKLK